MAQSYLCSGSALSTCPPPHPGQVEKPLVYRQLVESLKPWPKSWSSESHSWVFWSLTKELGRFWSWVCPFYLGTLSKKSSPFPIPHVLKVSALRVRSGL